MLTIVWGLGWVVTSIERTAYPRFKRLITAHELHLFFSPTRDELEWAAGATDGDEHLLALLLMLKSYQRMGCFPALEDVPEQVVEFVRRTVELPEGTLPVYRAERTAKHHRGLVRKRVGVAYNQAEARRVAEQSIRKEAAAKNRPADLINIALVERVMREHGIAGNGRRTGRRSLTKADTTAAPSPDLIGRDFTATRPGTKIVGDITYIPTAEGWLYPASWLDLATREVIGYSMADHHRGELVVDALDMAAALGRLEPGCVIDSDRGSEYTSGQLQSKVRELGHRKSMGRTGSCFDNAAAESFWAVLKEEIGTRFWPDRATAHADIFDFVETFYNRRRLRKHIHWGYLTPHETRLRYQQDQALAA